VKIALIQICSGLDPKENIAKIRGFLDQAVKENVEAVFLPEVFYSMSDGTGPTPYLVEEDNEHFKEIEKLPKDYGVYILGGTAATLVDGKVFNRAYNFDPEGNLINLYDKINLFSCDLSDHESKQVLDEADMYVSGNKLEIFDLKEFKVGMTVCYDLRFPEMFRKLSFEGANVFSVSSAFTVPTGRAHWETLLKARAIENQAYVVATDQWGDHNKNIKTWGHSMVVNPWGEVIANAGEGEKIIYAELDINLVHKYRKRIPVLRDPTKL
jgi:predicted amidohydrolase